MTKIKEVIAREILDSRGNPTIETKVFLENNAFVVSSVPSGASKGSFEAVELRDNDQFRYRGQGVLKAVENVNKILGPKIIGWPTENQEEIDNLLLELDGTTDKSRLGANAILSVSQAVCEAGAASAGIPTYKYVQNLFSKKYKKDITLKIPTPSFNLINGGKHGAGNNLNFQEFHIIPIIPTENYSFGSALLMANTIYKSIGQTLQQHGYSFSVGDEGGYAPDFYSNEEAIKFLINCGEKTEFVHKKDFLVGLDLAANSFIKKKGYRISDCAKMLKTGSLIDFYLKLREKYYIYFFEDPIVDNDWRGWMQFTHVCRKRLVIGDDLLCTNVERIKKAVQLEACNAVLIKPNQTGTISETILSVVVAKNSHLKIVVSHRSGETNEDFIADFSVGVGADMVKFGAPSRGERVAKYNRLLEIEKEIMNCSSEL